MSGVTIETYRVSSYGQLAVVAGESAARGGIHPNYPHGIGASGVCGDCASGDDAGCAPPTRRRTDPAGDLSEIHLGILQTRNP